MIEIMVVRRPSIVEPGSESIGCWELIFLNVTYKTLAGSKGKVFPRLPAMQVLARSIMGDARASWSHAILCV